MCLNSVDENRRGMIQFEIHGIKAKRYSGFSYLLYFRQVEESSLGLKCDKYKEDFDFEFTHGTANHDIAESCAC